MYLWFFLFPLIRSNNGELPYDEESTKDNLDSSTGEKAEISDDNNMKSSENEEITVPWNEIFGISEIFAIILFTVTFLFYIIGQRNIQRNIQNIQERFAPLMRKYFLVVPDYFGRLSNHEFVLYLTGRTGYTGGFVNIKFSKRSDLLGFLWDKLWGTKTTISFELLCTPYNQSTAIYSLGKKLRKEYEPFELKEIKIPEVGLTAFTDFGSSRERFNQIVREYGKKNTNVIKEIDMSDMNRFQTRMGARFVARFCFDVLNINNIINEETINFVIKMADEFNELELDTNAYQNNIRIRALIAAKDTKQDPQTMADSMYDVKMRAKAKKEADKDKK